MVQYVGSPATITVTVKITAGFPPPQVDLTLFANGTQIGAKSMVIPKGQSDSLVAQIFELGNYTIVCHAVASNLFGTVEGDSPPFDIVVGEAPIIEWGIPEGVWGSLLATYNTVSSNQYGLAWDGSYLWALESAEKRIYKINPSDGTQVTRIDIPSLAWYGLDYFNGFLYASEGSIPRQVHKIDPATGTDLAQWNTTNTYMGLANDGTNMYATETATNKIHKINPLNGSILDTWDIGIDVMRGLAWDGTNLLMVSYSENKIFKLDFESKTIIGSFNITGTKPYGLAYDGANIWNLEAETKKLYKYQG